MCVSQHFKNCILSNFPLPQPIELRKKKAKSVFEIISSDFNDTTELSEEDFNVLQNELKSILATKV